MRVLVDRLPDPGDFTLEGEEVHHLLKVKRIRAGEEVELLDGKGGRAYSQAEQLGNRVVQLSVKTVTREAEPLELGIVLAIPCQLSTLSGVLPGLVQSGVTRMIFCETDFSGSIKKAQTQLRRFQTILSQSLKQCGRAWIPRLEFMTFKNLLAQKEDSLFKVWHIYHPGGCTWESQRDELIGPLINLIGPEGGFSEEEVEQATSAGAVLMGLGPSILKMETAAIGVSFRVSQHFIEV